MCIDIDGHYSGGSSFVYVNGFCYYRNCLYTHRYKFSSKKKKKGKESQYIVSRPELGSDPPFGSDWEPGCDSAWVWSSIISVDEWVMSTYFGRRPINDSRFKI